MLVYPEFILPSLTEWQRSRFLGQATRLLKAQHQIVTQSKKSIVSYTLQKKRRHQQMNHYPKGDRIDRNTGAQYFYHCHRENLESSEQGHFHCFLRYKHIPQRIKPKPLTDWDKHLDNPMTHLVAIGMDRWGQPIRLFTVNRWISSEICYEAKHLPFFIKRFRMTIDNDAYWKPLDQWVASFLHLFQPQIAWLHEVKDRLLLDRQAQFPDRNAYEDRELEELSSINIDLAQQIQWIVGQTPSS